METNIKPETCFLFRVVGKGAQEAMTMLVPCNANVWFM
jgi:hypothetical protein